MVDFAAAKQKRELQPGARESQFANRVFVNIRIGKIAQTDNRQLPGFVPAQTRSLDGTINNFFARPYDDLVGFVTDIRFRKHTIPNGTVLSGWAITIDTTNEIFVLEIGTNDRPYQRLMNCLLNVDFDKLVMFRAFMGKDHKERPVKVLLLSQELGDEDKPIWVRPAMEEKWLTRIVIDKLKAGLDLTPEEEKRVVRNADGSFRKEYPYVVENSQGKWSMETYTEYLFEQMNEHVLPNCKAAAERRGIIQAAAVQADLAVEEGSDPASYSGPPPSDDDIPF